MSSVPLPESCRSAGGSFAPNWSVVTADGLACRRHHRSRPRLPDGSGPRAVRPRQVIVVSSPARTRPDAAVARLDALALCAWTRARARGPDIKGPTRCGRCSMRPTRSVRPPVSPWRSSSIRSLRGRRPHLTAKALRVARRAIDAATMNAKAREDNAWRMGSTRSAMWSTSSTGRDPGRLRGLLTGVPAIVVGAGPSLDRTDGHAAARSKAAPWSWPPTPRGVRWSARASSRTWSSRPIQPRPTAATSAVLAATAGRGSWRRERRPRCATGTARPRWRLPYCRPSPVAVVAGLGVTRDVVKAWGSVLTSAYDMATAGCHPVVFAGADLSFTDRRPHPPAARRWKRTGPVTSPAAPACAACGPTPSPRARS